MKIVDLTLPIQKHWRYGVEFSLARSHAAGDPWQITAYNLQSHWFTHIDAPIHHSPGGADLDAYPIGDWCFSTALILDFTGVPDNGGIDAGMLEKAAGGHDHYDTLFLRTDRGRKVPFESVEFWDNSPYVTADGGEWIRDYRPKVVGFDFPQDYEIRKIRTMKPGDVIHQPVHDHVLVEGGILMIEYLTNLWSIGRPVCDIVALPLKTVKADGAQIRVIAVLDRS
jgi:kynurenine formamidase